MCELHVNIVKFEIQKGTDWLEVAVRLFARSLERQELWLFSIGTVPFFWFPTDRFQLPTILRVSPCILAARACYAVLHGPHSKNYGLGGISNDNRDPEC